MQDSNLVGFVTDEDRSEDITGSLKTLANKMDWSLDRKIIATENYLGTGVYLLFKRICPPCPRDISCRPCLLQKTWTV